MDRAAFFFVAWLATLANAGATAGVFLLVMRARGRWFRALPAAVVVSAIVFLGTAAVFIVLRCGFFGLVALAYLAFAAVPPALGLCLIATRRFGLEPQPAARLESAIRRGRSRAVQGAVGAVLLAPPIVCAYASFIAPYQLVLEEADVVPARSAARESQSGSRAPVVAGRIATAGAAAAEPPIRVGVLADLQTDRAGDHERRAIEMLTSASPDLILLAGDYFQVPAARLAEASDFVALLSGLRAPAGCFAVLGDVDWPRQTAALLSDAGIRLLMNEIATIEVRGVRIAIAGLELHATSRAARETMDRLNATPANVRIVLSHRPDAVLMARPDDRIDLFVAGHTHGGQVVIPGFGPPLTLTQVPRGIAAGGLGEVNGRRIYVSRGVGFERGRAPPMRLFCPPEVSLLTLRR